MHIHIYLCVHINAHAPAFFFMDRDVKFIRKKNLIIKKKIIYFFFSFLLIFYFIIICGFQLEKEATFHSRGTSKDRKSAAKKQIIMITKNLITVDMMWNSEFNNNKKKLLLIRRRNITRIF